MNPLERCTATQVSLTDGRTDRQTAAGDDLLHVISKLLAMNPLERCTATEVSLTDGRTDRQTAAGDDLLHVISKLLAMNPLERCTATEVSLTDGQTDSGRRRSLTCHQQTVSYESTGEVYSHRVESNRRTDRQTAAGDDLLHVISKLLAMNPLERCTATEVSLTDGRTDRQTAAGDDLLHVISKLLAMNPLERCTATEVSLTDADRQRRATISYMSSAKLAMNPLERCTATEVSLTDGRTDRQTAADDDLLHVISKLLAMNPLERCTATEVSLTDGRTDSGGRRSLTCHQQTVSHESTGEVYSHRGESNRRTDRQTAAGDDLLHVISKLLAIIHWRGVQPPRWV